MEKLTVKGFGPIDECNLNISNFMVFIGDQASGKSTISKIVYYCKSLRDDFLGILLEALEDGNFEKIVSKYMQYARSKFLNFFGTTMHLDDIYIKYEYSDEMFLEIGLEKKHKYINHTFCPKMYNNLLQLIDEVKNYYEEIKSRQSLVNGMSAEKIVYDTYKKSVYKNITDKVNFIFFDEREYIYIPAGRSILTTLSTSLNSLFKDRDVFDREIDFITRAFIERIVNLRGSLVSLEQLLSEKKAVLNKDIPHEFINEALRIMKGILKGRYVNESGIEKILLENSSKYIKLNFASSGQQESIWILNLLFWYMLYGKKCYLIIEEPEAHLFPTAQIDIVSYISLFFNSNDNMVIIPTHSPYVLAAINNLIYAHQIGSQKGAESDVNKIINKNTWISNEKVGVFKMEDGRPLNIVDNEETGLINTKLLDRPASLPINETFEKLMDLEDKYGRVKMEQIGKIV